MIEIVTFCLWVGVVAALAPSACRYALGHYSDADEARTGKFFMALLWVAGLGRIVFFPNDNDLRTAVIALSAVCAAYLLFLRARHWK